MFGLYLSHCNDLMNNYKYCFFLARICTNSLVVMNRALMHAVPYMCTLVLFSHVFEPCYPAFVHPLCMDTLHEATPNQAVTSSLPGELRRCLT